MKNYISKKIDDRKQRTEKKVHVALKTQGKINNFFFKEGERSLNLEQVNGQEHSYLVLAIIPSTSCPCSGLLSTRHLWSTYTRILTFVSCLASLLHPALFSHKFSLWDSWLWNQRCTFWNPDFITYKPGDSKPFLVPSPVRRKPPNNLPGLL